MHPLTFYIAYKLSVDDGVFLTIQFGDWIKSNELTKIFIKDETLAIQLRQLYKKRLKCKVTETIL